MIHLYIKTHNETGLKYFGKTTAKDPYKYLGSGKRWLAHLKQHGKNISTELLGSFEDQAEASLIALRFSSENEIVTSPLWANMIPENAIDGQPAGTKRKPLSDAHRQKIAEASKARWADQEYKNRLKEKHREVWTEDRHKQHSQWLNEHWTEERRARQSKAIKGSHPIRPRGIPKSEEHRALIGLANSKPKVRCSRIFDRREMSVNAFTKWFNRVQQSGISG